MKAAIYVAATTLAASAAGALLGAGGASVAPGTRAALATVLALGAVWVGAAELRGRRVRLLQRDAETPQSWVHAGPLRWALANGATLGIGAGSRLGFWLWYAVPIGSFLSGSVVLATVTYGVYGLVRGSAAVALLIVAGGRAGSMNELALRVLSWRGTMRRVAAAQTALLGMLVAVGAGTQGL